MIYEVEGDILLTKAAAIVHGVAPNDDFNQGLAFSLKESWPSLYKDFRHYSHPGKATPAYVNHALKELRKQLEENPVESLAIPKLATGVGGLDWSEVQGLIEKHLADLDIPVYVYATFKKDVKAQEL